MHTTDSIAKKQTGRPSASPACSIIFRARNGFDFEKSKATAGRGCLVGHVKKSRQKEKRHRNSSGLRPARSRSCGLTRTPEQHRCSLVLNSVTASKTGGRQARLLKPHQVSRLVPSGGGCVEIGAPLNKPVIRSPRNRKGHGFNSRRVHHLSNEKADLPPTGARGPRSGTKGAIGG